MTPAPGPEMDRLLRRSRVRATGTQVTCVRAGARLFHVNDLGHGLPLPDGVGSDFEFEDVPAREVMNTEPPLLEQSANVCRVARMLRRYSHLWIVTEKGSRTLVGVITESDFIDLLSPIPDRAYATGMLKSRSLQQGQMSTAGDAMVTPVITCAPDTPVSEALELFRERDIRHLAVVENNEIIGELSLKGIIAAFYISSCSMLDSA
jgi:CBS domain-containing protein